MQVLKQLAERLTAEFGNGFSLTNLKFMRQFYVLYAPRIGQTTFGFSSAKTPRSIGQTLSDLLASGNGKRPFTLSWSHYVFLLGIKKADERSFYEIESTQQNWTLRELRRQFQSGLYERLVLCRDQDGIRQFGKCSAHTAQLDINDLLARGVLGRLEGGGRSTGYVLVK